MLSREWASAKEEKRAAVGRGRQGSNARSGDSKPRDSCWNYGKEGHRMADCTTKRKLGSPGGQQQATAQPGGATSGQQFSFRQNLKQESGPPSHVSGKGAQQGATPYTPTRAVFSSDGQQEGLDISPIDRCHRCLLREDSLWKHGHPFQRGSVNKVTRFWAEGVAVNEK